ncbi:MAG: hydroxymethylglutaryl-CoA lyase [Bacteroidota bacterium]
MNTTVKITECPRDAMQGLKEFIPTHKKIEYINQLLKVGFDTLDCGSFVSAKAIPQLVDSTEVFEQIESSNSKTKLLAIIANSRGAEDAVKHKNITYLGFPFSISETFQQRNTNSSIAESLVRVQEIQNLCVKNNKELLVYISMAFGNPYGDDWNSEIVIKWAEKLRSLGIKSIALADTIGVSNQENISYLFKNLIPAFSDIEFGAHLHSTPETAMEKIEAAYNSGCKKFDVAIGGLGGCPMAADDLTGNMATEQLYAFLVKHNINSGINNIEFEKAQQLAKIIFPTH